MGGSSSTQRTQIPDYLSDASRLAVQRADQIFEAGRMPYTGIDVVGINPSEKAAMENVASAASAFGMAVPQGDPFAGMEAQTTNGLTGYSSMPIYISDMKRLQEQRPDQYAAFAKLTGFDPITGEAIAPPPAPIARGPVYSSNNDDGGPSHAEIMAMHYGTTPNSLTTGGPSAASQAVFSQADLMGNHGGSYASKIKSDIGKLVSGGGIFGAIGNSLTGEKDPSIGNVP